MLTGTGVPGKVDDELRVRLAEWTRYLMKKHGIPSKRAMARRMDVSGPTVTNAINKKAGIGLDYLVALHRTFHESADVLLDTDPPWEALDTQGHPKGPTRRGGVSREPRATET